MDNFVINSGDVVSVEVSAPFPLVSVEVLQPSSVDAVVIPGPQGPPGAPGPAFEGVAWWYGVGDPVAVVGSKPGDYYVDTSSGNIFILGD